MDSWGTERKLKKKQGLPFLTPEDILKEGKSCTKEESPIDLTFNDMKEVRMTMLEWENFAVPPKLMKISNSGTTAILSAKWHGPRPYLTNGPVSGHYVFSQLHFHWGRSFEEGSEHRINGESLPLEAHAMFFKNIYLSQEDAMKKIDGIITLAYFFNLQEEDNEYLNPIIDSLSAITTPLTSEHIEPVALKQFIPSFSNDYFLYWGNVANMNVLWLICRKPLGIGAKQLSSFQNLIGSDQKPIEKNFRNTKDLNHRVVFHVNPSDNKSYPLLIKEDDKRGESKKISTNVYSIPGVQTNVINQALYTVAEHEGSKGDIQNINGFDMEFSPKRNSNNCFIGDSEKKKDSVTDLLNLSLKDKSNVKELKYTLARILLELEKKEKDDDFGVLENYIKAKYSAAHEKLMMERNLHKSDHNKDGDESTPKSESYNHLDEEKTLTQKEHIIMQPDRSVEELHEETKVIFAKQERSDMELNEDEKSTDDQSEELAYRGKHPLQEDNTSAEIYNKRKCKSVSENDRFSRTLSHHREGGYENPEVLKSRRAELKVEKKQSSHCIRKKSGEMLSIRTSCEVEKTVTILETMKAGSVRRREMSSSDSDASHPRPTVESSSDDGPRIKIGSRRSKALPDFDIKAIKERLRKKRLTLATPKPASDEVKGSSNTSPAKTPVQRKEKSNPAALQARDEGDSERRRALIHKSMMRLMKDRPQTANKSKPKTPERPAWKP